MLLLWSLPTHKLNPKASQTAATHPRAMTGSEEEASSTWSQALLGLAAKPKEQHLLLPPYTRALQQSPDVLHSVTQSKSETKASSSQETEVRNKNQLSKPGETHRL